MNAPRVSAEEREFVRDRLRRGVEVMLWRGLSERDLDMLLMPYGLGGKRMHTLKERGQAYWLSYNGARLVLSKALSKLRHPTLHDQAVADGDAWKLEE
jgi:DNA-directed RNA polymerase sigma subunit (sigma70/sigma32)